MIHAASFEARASGWQRFLLPAGHRRALLPGAKLCKAVRRSCSFRRLSAAFAPMERLFVLLGRLLAGLAVALASVSGAFAQERVLISEFMAAGQYAVADEDGDYPDWIELHNPGATAIRLTGWHLTDREDQPARWTLPEITLPPNGYLVIFASGKDRTISGAELHTSFRLDPDGEYLALTRPDGSVAFAFAPYPAQMPDVAFDHAHRFLGRPTPGAANDEAPLAIAAAPVFSEAHGFKREPFQLRLGSETPGAKIRYTLEGSEPSETKGELFTGSITIRQTSVVRAVAFTSETKSSPIITRTYLFVPDIVKQSPDGSAPQGWPQRWGNNKTDYGMDPRITTVEPYKKKLREGLRAIPSISLVLPLDALFSTDTGIYSHPQERGREWERAASIELIDPQGGPGFQQNGGLRIRGGASRDLSDPKHSLRVFFRRSYGAPELDFPLFGSDGAPTCDKFDLRWDQIASWHWTGDPKDDFIRDQWARDTQLAMGQPSGRGDFYHLYINGQYFGLFNTQERHDASYAESYFGGDEEDYDVVKYDNTAGGTNETDGTIAAWRRVHDAAAAGLESAAAYQRVQGNNPDGTRNRSFERLVDVDNLIDYMLLGLYSAASDNPPANGAQNNWGAIKSRKGNFGFRFFVHDWELSMFRSDDDLVTPQPITNPLDGVDYSNSNVWHIWEALRFNADFRMRVADRIQKHFFGGGALTPEKAAERFKARMDEIRLGVIAESARWGDAFYKNSGGGGGGPIHPLKDRGPGSGGGQKRLLTPQDWLQATRVAFLQNYFPVRTGIVLQQFRERNLYPALEAPGISPGSGNIAPDELIAIQHLNSAGVVFFTLDGTDPRRLGGTISAAARVYDGPVKLGVLKQLKARVKDGEIWSALVEARYENTQDFRALQLTEIGYHFPSAEFPGDDLDFLELKNAGTVPLDLSGLLFENGITFTFPVGTVLAPGKFFVLGRNAARFAEAHPGQALDGVFAGRLADGGEELVLSAGVGVPVIALHYRPELPWPPAANGAGFTLVRASGGSPNNGANWRASAMPGGSPHADDPAPQIFPRVVVQRLDSRPANGTATITLANLDARTVDLSGWWLTNDLSEPRQQPIPAGTVLPAFGETTLPFSAFATGGDAFVFGATPGGGLTGYAHGFSHGPVAMDRVHARVVNSAAEEKFAPAQIGDVVLNEIHYFPEPGAAEFIELRSLTSTAVDLRGWKLDGFGFTFPAGAILPAQGMALVVSGDPAAFRARHQVGAEVPVFGPANGTLQDNGETLALQRPIAFDKVPGTFFETIESLRYNDKDPWPFEAAGRGSSLQRPRSALFADDPASWLAASPSPGAFNTVNASPTIRLTWPRPGTTVTPPEAIQLRAEAADDDSGIARVEFVVDHMVVGEATAPPYSFAWDGADTGLHDLTARAFDVEGSMTESAPVTVLVHRPEEGAGLGLRGEYFGNPDLAGSPVLIRNDPTINFQWSDIDPARGLSRKSFSVRWTGTFVPTSSGNSNFTVQASGGVRLILDGAVLADEWEGEHQHYIYAPFVAAAGRPVSFQLEYRDGDGFAGIQVILSEAQRPMPTVLPTSTLYLPEQDPAAFSISSPAELPAGRVGEPYLHRFRSVRGTAPVTVEILNQIQGGSVTVGGDGLPFLGLPQGIALDEMGAIVGTPTTSGLHRFSAQMTDANGNVSVRRFGLQIRPPANVTPLSLELTSPARNAKLRGETVQLSGRATSVDLVQRVEYSLNGRPWRPMAIDATRAPVIYSGAFEVALDEQRGLNAGENVLLVRALDELGNVSRTLTRRFSVRQFSQLRVGISGAGKVSPEFLGVSRREINETYTVHARPAPGFILQQWMENGFFTGIANRDYTFRMSRNLEITAVFIPDPFPKIAGHYITGIGGAMDESRARGLLNLQIAAKGALTGKLRLGGNAYPFSGAFDSFGYFYVQLAGGGLIFENHPRQQTRHADIEPRPGDENLSLSFAVDFETGEIRSYINLWEGDSGFNLEDLLACSGWSAKSPCPLAGIWDLNISALEGAPSAAGRVRLEITPLGAATVTGTLADGEIWATRSFVTDDLRLPLYRWLYDRAGCFAGELSFSSGSEGSGEFFWEKPENFSGRVQVTAKRRP